MNIIISGNVAGAEKALANYPGLLRMNVLAALDRGAAEVAREARRLAPKAFTTLANSIRAQSTGEFERTVAPGVNYAAYVEQGSGPAVGKARYMPNPANLEAWVKQRAGIRITGAKGSKKRAGQFNEIRDRAWALAKYIQIHGTKPHPYMAPAAANLDSRVKQLLANAVLSANQGAFKV